MGSYMQMGHDTENLVGEMDLQYFKGIVLSPLNRKPHELKSHISSFRDKGDFDIVFDPQLYFPRTSRSKIREHPYFPSDFETANYTSIEWWKNLNSKLLEYVSTLNVDTLISPVVAPRICTDEYYHTCIEVNNHIYSQKTSKIKKYFATLFINVNDICDNTRLMKIASFATLFNTDGLYLVFMSNLEPRREFKDEEVLLAMLKLSLELKNLQKELFVSFTSSDMILFKSVGIDNCGTGKFFNLRRFTSSRFEEPSGGGGQLPYWLEHNLMAFLRESDIVRMQRNGLDHLLKGNKSNNHWSNKILDEFSRNPGSPWLGHGWRQYLSWFSKTEEELSHSDCKAKVGQWLKTAEENWLLLENNNILMEERANDGGWLRAWRQTYIRLNQP